MRILVICDARVPVPPKDYGGTERVAAMLCEALSDRGHIVDLIAAKNSNRYSGKLFTHKPPTLSKISRIYRKTRFQLLSLRAALRADVVVNYGRTDYLWLLGKIKKPIVFVLQNPVDQPHIDAIASLRPSKAALVFVSQNQCDGLQIPFPAAVIHNAVPLADSLFNPAASQPPYLVFLGRLTANKGVHLAIEAAKRTDLRLILAGNVPESEPGATAYFHDLVEPELGDQIKWIGPVDDEAKSKLLSGATAMLFPIQWQEPFGIVMAESLACGCPVIAWRNGSVSEVIRHGETGFIVESVEEMADAIRNIHRIDRAECRRDAEQRFSAELLAEKYLRVINDVVSRGTN